jgi:hypothetical protein
MITKWRLHYTNYIENGNLGRSDALSGRNCILETVAVGTVVTTWQEEERIVNHFDSDGEITGVSSLFLISWPLNLSFSHSIITNGGH